MEVVGKIKVIGNAQQVSDKFVKRDIVVTTDEQYPQEIQIQFVQDKCDLLNSFAVGQEVKIGINLRGREWTNAKGELVYFNTIQGWNCSTCLRIYLKFLFLSFTYYCVFAFFACSNFKLVDNHICNSHNCRIVIEFFF